MMKVTHNNVKKTLDQIQINQQIVDIETKMNYFIKHGFEITQKTEFIVNNFFKNIVKALAISDLSYSK